MLKDCLISLFQQRSCNFEVIIVNGPSTDDTEAVIGEFRHRIKPGQCDRANLSASRNIGLGLAAGDICAFIDDDAVAHPDWIARLSAPYADAAVGGVGGFTFDHTGTRFQCRYTVCNRHGEAKFFDEVDPSIAFSSPGTWWHPSLLGTNSSFRRSALEEIGGFDETFAYMLDETDVCLRLFDRGWEIRTLPDAYVFHRYAPSHHRTVERVPRSLLAPSRSKAYFCVKHRRQPDTIAQAIESIDQYRRDMEFSTRWHLDHGNLGPDEFYRLNGELHSGLTEGITLGLQAKDLRGHLPQRRDAPPPLLRCPTETDRRLRLCLVSQGFPPRDTAGIARWTEQLAGGLVALGHEVHVVTAGADPCTEFSAGLWVHAVPPCGSPGPLPPVPLPENICRRAGAVRDEVLRIRSIWGLDLVSAPIWDLEGILCATDFPVPLVTSLHSTYGLVLPFKEHWKEDFVYRRLHVQRLIAGERWLLRHSAAILANSNAIVNDILPAYGVALDRARLSIVPHGVSDAEQRRPAEPPTEAGPLRVLYVGRLERRKGLDVLLAALSELGAHGRGLTDDEDGAPVEGEPEFRTLVKKLASRLDAGFAGQVRFHGYAEDDALLAHYDACDLLVAPSRYESFGLIAIEAMRFGKAVLASRVGGLAEIVREDVEGWLFDPDRPAELAAILRRLATDREQVARAGRAARLRYEQEFTVAKMARRVAQAYRSVVDDNSGQERLRLRGMAWVGG